MAFIFPFSLLTPCPDLLFSFPLPCIPRLSFSYQMARNVEISAASALMFPVAGEIVEGDAPRLVSQANPFNNNVEQDHVLARSLEGAVFGVTGASTTPPRGAFRCLVAAPRE